MVRLLTKMFRSSGFETTVSPMILKY